MPNTDWQTVTLGGQDSSATGGGTNTWSAPDRVTAEDGSLTTCNGLTPGAVTRYLRGSGADLSSIPDDTDISGIGIEVRVKGQESGGFGSVSELYLRTNTTSEVSNSDNLATSPQYLPTSNGFVTFGSTTSRSGYTGNIAAIKAAGFGFACRVTNAHPAWGLAPSVDVMQIRVTWPDPPPAVARRVRPPPKIGVGL